jgi:hypothetical protein
MRRISSKSPVLNKGNLSEHYEQVYFVSWFRKTFNDEIIAIPNGGARSRSEGAKMKAEGVKRGVSDLFIPAWFLWIEMKRADGGNGMSKEQKEWAEYVKSLGYDFMCCNGFEHAKSCVLRHLELEEDEGEENEDKN